MRVAGILTNQKDFTCQIGEWLVAELFNGVRAKSGIQPGWDVKVGERKIQVKAHAKALTNSAKYSELTFEIPPEIDELVVVVFTPDYKLKNFYLTPWKEALKILKPIGERKYKITWTSLRNNNFEIKASNLPKQDIVELFQ